MLDNETYEFEDSRYVVPTMSRDEQIAFLDNLRETQAASNADIERQTRNLGTKISLNQGGLTSGATSPDSYFMTRYQTPQVNAQVADLKAQAQLSALNNVLSNDLEAWKARYNEAKRAASKRANSGGGGNGGGYPATKGTVITEDTGDTGKSILDGGIISNPAVRPSFIPDNAIENTYSEGGNVYTTYVDPVTGRVYAKYENGNLVSGSPSSVATDVGRKVSLYYPQTARGVGPGEAPTNSRQWTPFAVGGNL